LKNVNWSTYNYNYQKDISIPKHIKVDSILDLSSELTIGGHTTTYIFVTSQKDTLIKDTDYQNDNGKIKFLTSQVDSVYGNMVNASFPGLTKGINTVNTFIGTKVTAINNPIQLGNGIDIYSFQDQLFVKSIVPMQVTVYTTSGNVISTWQNYGDTMNTISTPGIYVVKASNDSQFVTQKVVVE
jgi:hypothetical protein